jgi:2-amino-4-hydroxy-6-hydroxymethyldihydropteridine diphosphokinase
LADHDNARKWVPAYIGLGSNLGDRRAFLAQGIQGLADRPEIEVERVSTIYETDPVGPQPQGPYLNAVARIRVALAPRPLLDALLEIERLAGRERDSGGPAQAARTLDLDLLLYADECIEEPGLVVPHPRLHERAFVLEPLLELAPDLIHPRLAESLASHQRAQHDPVAVRRWSEAGPESGRSRR